MESNSKAAIITRSNEASPIEQHKAQLNNDHQSYYLTQREMTYFKTNKNNYQMK